jgi:hypothetical protein
MSRSQPAQIGHPMFRCEKCGVVVPSGTSAHQLVVQQRAKEYPSRSQPSAGGRSRFAGRFERERTVDRGGEGQEIVRELKVCPACAEQYGAGAGE